jgi:hypothetical protein
LGHEEHIEVLFIKCTGTWKLIIHDTVLCIRGSRILDFWIFDLLQLNLDWQKNSKTKVEKAFFFIFMSSYAEMSFWVQKSEKVTK